jgi:hypothetical protein
VIEHKKSIGVREVQALGGARMPLGVHWLP